MATKKKPERGFIHVDVKSNDPFVVRAIAQVIAERLQELGFSTAKTGLLAGKVSAHNVRDFDDLPEGKAADLIEQVEQFLPDAFDSHTTVQFYHPYPPEKK